jgi:hypothetical protein
MRKIIITIITCIILVITLHMINAQTPSAPNAINNVSTEAPNPQTGGILNSSGGTISVVNITATTQNPRWKGFVGNISGTFALQDSSGSSLYSWEITSVTGELYALRNSAIPSWEEIRCANASTINTEESALNHQAINIDSISNTFDATNHNAFYVGTVPINANSCPTTALNVNNSEQTANFQEILLTDGDDLIYTGLIEDAAFGYNEQRYDFQMILAENAAEGEQQNEAYYFYVELI